MFLKLLGEEEPKKAYGNTRNFFVSQKKGKRRVRM